MPGDLVYLGQRPFTWRAHGAGAPTRYERLVPAGTLEQLPLPANLKGPERAKAFSVFADWLIEHGSAWGDWIRASLDGHTDVAATLADELTCHLHGPLFLIHGGPLSETESMNFRFD